ncbi:HAD-IA family hydrolase [Nocardioides anomalus]|uniref:HAD-IA family hydrolase n=2 Tax=Nocardioides anomalus TaxID=2712223 RepID=A0A6G6WKT3_9ACTN|nr:HAD-IA family hydrolase [Nocardioides anomalus]
MGEAEATRFLAEYDFMAFNHGLDSGTPWVEAAAELARTHPEWAEHAAAYREHFPTSLTGEVPGTVAIVRELSEAGVPMWGLTNWSAELYPHAPERFDFLGLLDDVVVSGAEGVAKPDPAIYAIVVARAGLPAADLVFVDDKEANVVGAIEAGLDGVLFTGADDLRRQLRDRGLPV